MHPSATLFLVLRGIPAKLTSVEHINIYILSCDFWDQCQGRAAKSKLRHFSPRFFRRLNEFWACFNYLARKYKSCLRSSPERQTEVPRVTLVPLPIRWNGSALGSAQRLSPAPLWVQFNEYVMAGKKFPLISPPESCSITKSFMGRPAICSSGRLSAAGSCFSTPLSLCHFPLSLLFFFPGCPRKLLRPLFNLNL